MRVAARFEATIIPVGAVGCEDRSAGLPLQPSARSLVNGSTCTATMACVSKAIWEQHIAAACLFLCSKHLGGGQRLALPS